MQLDGHGARHVQQFVDQLAAGVRAVAGEDRQPVALAAGQARADRVAEIALRQRIVVRVQPGDVQTPGSHHYVVRHFIYLR